MKKYAIIKIRNKDFMEYMLLEISLLEDKDDMFSFNIKNVLINTTMKIKFRKINDIYIWTKDIWESTHNSASCDKESIDVIDLPDDDSALLWFRMNY